jgi:hypothetical protein
VTKVTSAKFKHLTPGTYTFFVLATDAVGNVGAAAKQRFAVEKKS